MIKQVKTIPKFFKEIAEELKKVSWSSRRELIDAALLVLAMTTVLTVYIFGIDIGLAKLMEIMIK